MVLLLHIRSKATHGARRSIAQQQNGSRAPVNGVQFWCWSALAAENCQRNKYLGIKEALQILIFAEFLKSLEIDLAVTRLGIA